MKLIGGSKILREPPPRPAIVMFFKEKPVSELCGRSNRQAAKFEECIRITREGLRRVCYQLDFQMLVIESDEAERSLLEG